ncbi:hypothetical protein TNIN_245731 [Trichonephila inaurata madagascariensis]|uniref:Uncharacterized protein n=1 Tax=Trichonephila inaurata madagascariensis TaxID=2747483 RepID=A0A8X7CP63_9ARAC|nr:hypothetical protein TNIN_245731 [Trichonephila inaurata madagascariensis]
MNHDFGLIKWSPFQWSGSPVQCQYSLYTDLVSLKMDTTMGAIRSPLQSALTRDCPAISLLKNTHPIPLSKSCVATHTHFKSFLLNFLEHRKKIHESYWGNDGRLEIGTSTYKVFSSR